MQAGENAIDLTPHTAFQVLQREMGNSVIGQSDVIHRLLITLLCNGNMLLEGLPGTAKTRVIKTLSRLIDASFGRIQFTPDLLPSDVTGGEVFHHEDGKEKLVFEPGPIFNHLILADEINRAPAKVQSALLEAMEERQVTVAGKSHSLPKLFMVLATQNPVEQEGTYPLPEAQVDRFLVKVRMPLSDDEAERRIIQLMRSEEAEGESVIYPVLSQHLLFEARREIQDIYVAPAIENYIVALIMATREPQRYDPELAKYIEVGASSRAGIALDRVARANAWLDGRNYVDPDDVRRLLADVLRHRLHLSYEALAEGVDSDHLIQRLSKCVPVA